MQGEMKLAVRGKKADVERYRVAMGFTELPKVGESIRSIIASDEWFSLGYDEAPDTAVVKEMLQPGSSGNTSGFERIFGDLNEQFPMLETIMELVSLDCEEYGDIYYSAAGDSKVQLFNVERIDDDIENGWDWNRNRTLSKYAALFEDLLDTGKMKSNW